MKVDLGPQELSLDVQVYNPRAPGRPLVVLHGFLEHGAAWRWVAEQLNRPVYAPDQRGHGRSEHVGRGGFYHFWDYISDLDLLLEQLSPGGPVDLLGHSMGGTVACLYAGTRPERVHRLVLVEGLGPPDTSSTLTQRAKLFLEHRRNPHRNPVLEDVPAAALRIRRHNRRLSEERALSLAEHSTRPVDGGVTWSWDARHRARSPRPFVDAQFIPFLQEITAPTLVIWGGASGFPGLGRAEHISGARVVQIPGAGHLVHLDAPESVAREVEGFLSTSQPAPSR